MVCFLQCTANFLLLQNVQRGSGGHLPPYWQQTGQSKKQIDHALSSSAVDDVLSNTGSLLYALVVLHRVNHTSVFVFLFGATATSGPWPPNFLGF